MCITQLFQLNDVFSLSVRSQDPTQRRVLDSATRQRRLTRQLEALEKDNFQDDPHASLPQLVKRLPQFDESNESGNEPSRCYKSKPQPFAHIPMSITE